MSLVWVTESQSGNKVTVNPHYVVAVFVATTGEHQGKTVLNMINGGIVIEESLNDTVVILNATE